MKIRTKILVGFFIIIALAIFLGITVFFNTVDVSKSFTFLVEHDLEVLQNAQKLQKLVVDAETGQRGFIITGDESFLEPYDDGINGFNALIKVEKRLVSDNPSQVQRLEIIQALFEEWQLKAAQPEIAAARTFFESSRIDIESGKTIEHEEIHLVGELLKSKTGKNILDQIRNEFTIFIQIENDLKDERLSDVITTSTSIQILLILIPISIAAVSVIIAFFFTQSISKPLEILKHASSRVSSGNLDTKIKQISIEKRKTKSVNKSSLKSANVSKPASFKNKMLAVFLGLSFLIGIIGLISYIKIAEVQDDLTIITDFQTPALVKLTEMKGTVLEGIEEAFAYPLLDAVIEKEEFYEKMNHFDLLSEEFFLVAHIGDEGEDIETKLFQDIISNKEMLVDSATQMFEEYENTEKIRTQYLELFEQEIDTLLPLIDEFIAIEIEEVNEARLHAQETINTTLLTLPVIILAAVLVSIFGGIVFSRSVSEPMVIVSGADEQLQKEYESQTSSSDDEIKELSDSFNIMVDEISKSRTQIEKQYAELKKTDIKKDEFASMVSHELKTPLVPIKLHAEMLLDGQFYGKLSDKQKDAVTQIFKSADNLQKLINDILDVRKIELEHLKLSKQEINVKDFLDENITILNSFCQEKNVTLKSEIQNSIKVFADPKRLSQVLSNLVKNSVDFVPEQGGQITIMSEKNNSEVIFTVQDNGKGIAAEDQNEIFKKFYQVDTSDKRKHGGTGLGLAICKGIIEAHGGKIWLDTQYTSGASFKFSIPSGNNQ